MEQSEEEHKVVQDKVDELKANKFKQMDLPAWRPVQSFLSTGIIFFVFGAIFLCIGVVLQIKSN